jgi:polyisoprenoid-binding protein YceI
MRRATLIFTVLATLLLISSCSNPASDKPKAVTNDAAPVAPAAPSPAANGEKYLITTENSKIQFQASKVTGSHHDSFEKFSGAIDYTGKVETSGVTINIETASVKTDDPGLTKHLQTPDFFDVAKFPTATFTSSEIKPSSGINQNHTVTGNLQLHGVTKSITFPATITVAPGAITVEAIFSINRKDFGINYAGAADNLIRDEVLMELHVKAGK